MNDLGSYRHNSNDHEGDNVVNSNAQDFIDSLSSIRAFGELEGSDTSPTDDTIKDALGYDALAEAEKRSGHSYKEDDGTQMAGMLDHVFHGGRKDALLTRADDTTLSNNIDRYLRILAEEGFEQALRLPFTAHDTYDNTTRDEALYVFWHARDGLLLKFDTYNTTRVNGGNVYYNVKPKAGVLPHDSDLCHGVTSSGGWHGADGDQVNWVWAGDHDCREALRFHLRQLREHGDFVTPWQYTPYLSMCHYQDYKDSHAQGLRYPDDFERHRQIDRERIALLPATVQDTITPRHERESAA